jgi:hypothetical protein
VHYSFLGVSVFVHPFAFAFPLCTQNIHQENNPKHLPLGKCPLERPRKRGVDEAAPRTQQISLDAKSLKAERFLGSGCQKEGSWKFPTSSKKKKKKRNTPA